MNFQSAARLNQTSEIRDRNIEDSFKEDKSRSSCILLTFFVQVAWVVALKGILIHSCTVANLPFHFALAAAEERQKWKLKPQKQVILQIWHGKIAGLWKCLQRLNNHVCADGAGIRHIYHGHVFSDYCIRVCWWWGRGIACRVAWNNRNVVVVADWLLTVHRKYCIEYRSRPRTMKKFSMQKANKIEIHSSCNMHQWNEEDWRSNSCPSLAQDPPPECYNSGSWYPQHRISHRTGLS